MILLKQLLLYPIGCTDSCRYASANLQEAGISLIDHPSPDVTHLLLDIPSREIAQAKEVLRMLPNDITVIGGDLENDSLSSYKRIDLLQDPYYLAKNATITAECALRVAASHLSTTLADSPTLILGWGRIGKCLANMLSSIGCDVTVAARKEADRAMLEALGYHAVDFPQISETLQCCRLLFNTVPALPLHSSIIDTWKQGIAIDLASAPGMQGESIISARGLPGKYAPESSGRLIAKTILRFLKEETK